MWPDGRGLVFGLHGVGEGLFKDGGGIVGRGVAYDEVQFSKDFLCGFVASDPLG